MIDDLYYNKNNVGVHELLLLLADDVVDEGCGRGGKGGTQVWGATSKQKS